MEEGDYTIGMVVASLAFMFANTRHGSTSHIRIFIINAVRVRVRVWVRVRVRVRVWVIFVFLDHQCGVLCPCFLVESQREKRRFALSRLDMHKQISILPALAGLNFCKNLAPKVGGSRCIAIAFFPLSFFRTCTTPIP